MIDTQTIAFIVAILFMLMASAFFSGSETALTAASRARLYALEIEGNRNAARAGALMRDRERLIGAILVGNNLVNLTAATLNTLLFTKLFGSSGVALAAATIVMTVLVVIFSEIAPKTSAIKHPDSTAMFVAPLMRWFVVLMSPVTAILQTVVRALLRLLGLDVARAESLFTASEELRGAVDLHHEEGAIDKGARDIVRGALDLNEIRVDEIMAHRKSIQMLDIEQSTADVIAAALKSQHTRLPLFRGSSDNIVGILHAKDLLRAMWDAEGDYEAINLSDLSRDSQIPLTTLQRHWALLEAVFLVRTLPAWSSNLGGRLIKESN